jgi:hypothetical protein
MNPQNIVNQYSVIPPSQAEREYSILFPLINDLESLSYLTETRTTRRGVTYEDVIVHASRETIDQTTTQTILTEDAEGNCSICQDQLKKDESVRTLSGCGHMFHVQCIDPWLLTRSVLCPTCRHDIRGELSLTANATSANATSANATSANATSDNATSANATSANATSANATSANTTTANTTTSESRVPRTNLRTRQTEADNDSDEHAEAMAIDLINSLFSRGFYYNR